jgi:hypothetical protein
MGSGIVSKANALKSGMAMRAKANAKQPNKVKRCLFCFMVSVLSFIVLFAGFSL